jgi:hypothetical protein
MDFSDALEKIPSETTGDRFRDLPTSSVAIPGPVVMQTIMSMGKWWFGVGTLEICPRFFNEYYVHSFVMLKGKNLTSLGLPKDVRLFTMELQ